MTPVDLSAIPPAPGEGWDCHVHVFDAAAPVLPGHYHPATRGLAEIEARARAAGVQHLVLVQPSVYGTDNTLMLQALQGSAGRHRGVAVVDAGVSEAELDSLHAAGVRGIRFNLVSPVGTPPDPALLLQQLAPRLRARGWHVQWYVRPGQLALVQSLQAACGLVFVLDHLAGCTAALETTDPAWSALAALAAEGAWVKLSGWYRLGATLPYDSLYQPLQRVAALFADHLVWGSDWPHTGLDPAIELPYDATWAPVRVALPPAQAQALRHQQAQHLYR